jgi:hypothetical protein
MAGERKREQKERGQQETERAGEGDAMSWVREKGRKAGKAGEADEALEAPDRMR